MKDAAFEMESILLHPYMLPFPVLEYAVTTNLRSASKQSAWTEIRLRLHRLQNKFRGHRHLHRSHAQLASSVNDSAALHTANSRSKRRVADDLTGSSTPLANSRRQSRDFLGLGSFLLVQLLENPVVERVYALNRPSASVSIAERQASAFVDKALPVDLGNSSTQRQCF
jgi:hypothetical protein